MSAKNRENKYLISNINIANLMSWENHCVRLSEISRIWLGKLTPTPFPVKTFTILLFITLSNQHIIGLIAMLALLGVGSAIWFYKRSQGDSKNLVHVKLHCGDTLSFSAKDEETVNKFYNVLKEAAESDFTTKIKFDTEGKIVKNSEKEVPQKMATILEVDAQNFKNGNLVNELQKLYLGYEKKTETNSEVLQLIDHTAHLMMSDDHEGLKVSFQKFVTLGLVSDCNELGLDSLIEEIKSSLY